MESLVTRIVKDIPQANRLSLEDLLGKELQSNQRVLILVLNPPTSPDDAARQQTAVGLRAILDEASKNAESHGITEAEINAAVEEAMGAVRHRGG